MTLFSVMWNSFVGIFLGATWNGSVNVNGSNYDSIQHAYASDPTTIIFIVFPLVGIGVAYVTATMWFNKTTIKYSHKGLEITRGPLPWPNSHVVIKHSNIRQCFVQTYVSHKRNNSAVRAYRVVASLVNGPETVIEKGLQSYRDARILEQWLESKLSIDDEAVHGEVAS